ncbi:MAG: hypothetical protein JWM91_3622 [Rhodospirillales bacterium]|nr:hypothetical protein [Rhodospirillales bacterium]
MAPPIAPATTEETVPGSNSMGGASPRPTHSAMPTRAQRPPESALPLRSDDQPPRARQAKASPAISEKPTTAGSE